MTPLSRFRSSFLRSGDRVRVSGTCSRFRRASRESPAEGGDIETIEVSGDPELSEKELEEVYWNMEEDDGEEPEEREQV